MLKNENPDLDKEGWNKLLESAKAELERVVPEDMTQAIVFETAAGKLYSTVITDVVTQDHLQEKAFLKMLTDLGDTHIKKMLCMWANTAIDFPSYDFARMMYEMNPQNASAEILRNNGNGYFVESIRGYMVRN